MANLHSVQTQIDILKSWDEIQKKRVMEPQNIEEVKKFIAEKKWKPGWESHEQSFKDWEDLITRYSADKASVTTVASTAMGTVNHTVVWATTPPTPVDTLWSLAGKSALESDLRVALQSELSAVDKKLENLTPENLEDALAGMHTILGLGWIEKVPGMKERAREILGYEPLIQWIAGATMLKKLQKAGYAIYFSAPNQIKIVSNKADARDIEAKINAHMSRSAVLGKSLQSGLLYSSWSFHTYRASISDNEWKIIDPKKADQKSYLEYLRKKPQNTLDASEKSFLYSEKFFDKWINFPQALIQSKDYNKVVWLMAQLTWDPAVNDLLPPGNNSSNQPSNKPSSDNKPASAPSTWAASMAWEWIGKVAWMFGKIAWTGAEGWLRVIGEIFSEATKHGGAWWALAVIWALIFSVWKGGFWKTLGGIFALGLADSAAKWKFSWLTSTPPKPQSDTWAPAPSAVSSPRDAAREWSPAAKITHTTLIARAIGRDNIQEANVDLEKSVIDGVKGMNFLKLHQALEKKDEASWKEALASINYNSLSKTEQEKIQKIIGDAKNQEILGKMTWHLANLDSIKAMKQEDKQSKSLEQIMNHVVENENKVKDPPKQEWVAQVKENESRVSSIYTLSEGHGYLYLLSRLMTQGYIPQLSDNTWSGSKDQWFLKRIGSGITYFLWDGGPLTNNKETKNPLVGAWHNGLQEKVAALTLTHATEEKNMISEALTAMKAKNIDGKVLLESELLDRKTKVDAIEAVVKKSPLDEKALKEALSAYEKSVKTKWEIIGNKLEMKWWANKWNIFKGVGTEAYVNKANNILINEKNIRDFWMISESTFHGMYDELKAGKIGQMIFQSWEDGKWYQVIEKNTAWTYKIQQVSVENGAITGKIWNATNSPINTIVSEINTWIRKMPWWTDRLKEEAKVLWEIVDQKKRVALDAFTAWESDTKSAEKKSAALAALEDYNKHVQDTNGKVSEKFALLSEAEAKSLGAQAKSWGWLSEFIHANTTGKNFGWVDKVDKLTSETAYVKGARKGFVWVGLLSLAYNSAWGFTDLVKEWKIGTIMTRALDIGIGMVPFVWSVHDSAILISEDYEKWMLGAKLSDEERAMRKWMIALGVIPGIWMALKAGGNSIKSGAMLATGSTIFKSGNLARSVATYGMLGISLVSASYDIAGKSYEKITK